MESSELICNTTEIFVNPAIIRDRFLDLMNTFVSVCDIAENEQRVHCPFAPHDYAVRVGCIEGCDPRYPWLNKLFLNALGDWIKTKNRIELGTWNSTHIDLRKIKDPEEIIQNIDNAKYIYISVPEKSAKKGIKMLAHTCLGYGTFVSAFKESEKEDQVKIEAKFDWKNDFSFLENCLFIRNQAANKKYKREEAYYPKQIEVSVNFGTAKIVEENGATKEEPSKLEWEEIFKYDMNKDLDKFPQRESIFLTDPEYVRERIEYWGHFFVPDDLMFDRLQSFDFEHFTMREVKRDLKGDGQHVIEEQYFPQADIDANVYQMKMKCGDFVFYSTRMWSTQEVKYSVESQRKKEKVLLEFQTKYYQFGTAFYEPKTQNEAFWKNPYFEPKVNE